MLLAMNFGGRIYRENGSDLDHQLQNKSENRSKGTFVLPLITSQTSLFLSAVSATCSSNAMKRV